MEKNYLRQINSFTKTACDFATKVWPEKKEVPLSFFSGMFFKTDAPVSALPSVLASLLSRSVCRSSQSIFRDRDRSNRLRLRGNTDSS